MKLKRCYRCKRSKPRSEFHRNRSRNDDCEDECKKCSSKRSKLAYHSDPAYRQKVIDRANKWQKTHPERRRAAWQRWREKMGDEEYNLYRREQYRQQHGKK